MKLPQTVPEQSAHLQTLLREKLRVKGKTLQVQVDKAGRRLPRKVRAAVLEVDRAQAVSAHPKLARQVNMPGITLAYRRAVAHLEAIDPAERRKDAILSLLASLAFNLLAVFALVLIFLVWRGFL